MGQAEHKGATKALGNANVSLCVRVKLCRLRYAFYAPVPV